MVPTVYYSACHLFIFNLKSGPVFLVFPHLTTSGIIVILVVTFSLLEDLQGNTSLWYFKNALHQHHQHLLMHNMKLFWHCHYYRNCSWNLLFLHWACIFGNVSAFLEFIVCPSWRDCQWLTSLWALNKLVWIIAILSYFIIVLSDTQTQTHVTRCVFSICVLIYEDKNIWTSSPELLWESIH